MIFYSIIRCSITQKTRIDKMHTMTARDYLNRGNDCRDKGNFELVIFYYTKFIAIDPKRAMVYNDRGVAYQNLGRFDEAISDHTQSIALNVWHANARAFYNRGIAHYAKGDFGYAIPDYTNAIGLNPWYTNAYYNRGRAHCKLGNFGYAISDYTKAIVLDPQATLTFNQNGTTAYDNLKNCLSNIKPSDDLSLIKKSDLLGAIKKLADIDQIPLLKQCLDENSALGKRFWQKGGIKSCSVENGTLKEICDRLIKLGHSPAIPHTTIPVTPQSFFNDNSIRKANYPDLNLDDPDKENNYGYGL